MRTRSSVGPWCVGGYFLVEPTPPIETHLGAGIGAYLAAHRSGSAGVGVDGVTLMLDAGHVRDDIEAGLCGFEVPGAKGGAFHSFHCNGLAPVYRSQLGIGLNSHGLIADFGDAERAAAFTTSPQAPAEPVPWQPWAVFALAPDAFAAGSGSS